MENVDCSICFIEVACYVVIDGVKYLVDIEIDDSDVVHYTFINKSNRHQAPVCRSQNIKELGDDLFKNCENSVDNKTLFYYAAKLCMPACKVHTLDNSMFIKRTGKSYFNRVASGFFYKMYRHLKYNGNLISSAIWEWDPDMADFKIA